MPDDDFDIYGEDEAQSSRKGVGIHIFALDRLDADFQHNSGKAGARRTSGADGDFEYRTSHRRQEAQRGRLPRREAKYTPCASTELSSQRGDARPWIASNGRGQS